MLLRILGCASFLATSLSATPPRFIGPVSQTVLEGHTASFSLTGDDATGRLIKWYRTDDLVNEVENVFYSPMAHDSGTYQAVVIDGSSELYSQTADLIVMPQKARPGMIDARFTAGDMSGDVRAIAVVSGDRIFIGGKFNIYRGQSANGLIVVNSSGAIVENIDLAPDRAVSIEALSWDGTNLYAGGRSILNEDEEGVFAKLDASGAVLSNYRLGGDPAFDGAVRAIHKTADGLLVGGSFSSYQGNFLAKPGLVRLLGESLDPGFNPPNIGARVLALTSSSDGIYVGGNFSNHLLRLDSSGKIDQEFADAIDVDDPVFALDVDSQRRILVGGNMTEILLRLSHSGQVDDNFKPTIDQPVHHVQAVNGEVWIGGEFREINQEGVRGIACLDEAGRLSNLFQGPGLKRFKKDQDAGVRVFAFSRDGLLIGGNFTRPQKSVIRLLTAAPEPTEGPPEILIQPKSQCVFAGHAVTLSAPTLRSEGNFYQWFKEDGEELMGTRSELVLPAMTVSDTGRYYVEVRRGVLALTTRSESADITVMEPLAGVPRRIVRSIPGAREFDNQRGRFEFSFELDEAMTIGAVKVHLSINHPRIDRLRATLSKSKGGAEPRAVQLFSSPGGSNIPAENLRATFDDEANIFFSEGDAPWAGTWKIDNGFLSSFSGATTVGCWSLIVDHPGIVTHRGIVLQAAVEIVEERQNISISQWGGDLKNFPLLDLELRNPEVDNFGFFRFTHDVWTNVEGLDYQYQILHNGKMVTLLPGAIVMLNPQENKEEVQLSMSSQKTFSDGFQQRQFSFERLKPRMDRSPAEIMRVEVFRKP